jgi:hypothetical protein
MSLKDSTNQVILNNYKQKGLEHTLVLCSKLLENKSLYREGAGFVLGEIAESVLEVLLIDYIRTRNLKDWFYVKGMIIKDVETMNRDFSTEIDLVLFSPQRIYLFECKGYVGSKTLTGKGVLERTGKNKVKFDVFSQHKNHATVFMKMFNPFILKDEDPAKCYRLAIFDFSSGKTIDNRDEKWKKIMPIIGPEDVFPMLDKSLDKRRKWNMEYVKKAVQIIERNKTSATNNHIKYVRDLDKRRGKK